MTFSKNQIKCFINPQIYCRSVCHANKENIHHLSTGTSNVNNRNSNNDGINPDNSHAVETDNPLTCTAMRNNTHDYPNEVGTMIYKHTHIHIIYIYI